MAEGLITGNGNKERMVFFDGASLEAERSGRTWKPVPIRTFLCMCGTTTGGAARATGASGGGCRRSRCGRSPPKHSAHSDRPVPGDCLGIDGHPVISTPNLDQLGRDGAHFRRAYSESPSCAPDAHVDSLRNILENPHVGLLFLIPGIDETPRVNGTATIVRDAALLARLAVDGKQPQLAISVRVEEAYLHCARSFLRARLWDPAHFQAPGALPPAAEMIQDQIRPPNRDDAERARVVAEAIRKQSDLYCHLN